VLSRSPLRPLISSWALLAAATAAAQERPPLPADTLPAELHALPTPLGLPELPHPLDPRAVVLGRSLFFDPVLSLDRSVSCASCHEPVHGFASPQRFPLGIAGHRARRHAPSIVNRAYAEVQLWDGRAKDLETQVLMPISDPDEMGLPLAGALERLRAEEPYRTRFAASFANGAVDEANLATALAAFVRTLRTGDTPVDVFRERGDRTLLTKDELAGLWLWESKGGCWKCHSGPNFSDELFHNTGVGAENGEPEPGRSAITSENADRGAFKTPTLRGLARTAPYMHDGSLATLEEVVAFYQRGGNANAHLDARMQPLELSEVEAGDLVAFLRALSREVALPGAGTSK
jgi:cytochrome c peroxidase